MEKQTFVFFGIIGSGKGTQVKLLINYLKDKDSRESLYAGTGEEFRKLINSDSYTANMVKETMIKGHLQPDFLTTTLFTNVLMHSLNDDKNLFADGYPRTVHQSESFDAMIKFFKRDNVKIIYIKISEEEAIRRNLVRGREDDTKEGIEKRIQEYINNVVPAMDFLKEKERYEFFEINGEQAKEDVFKDIIKVINL